MVNVTTSDILTEERVRRVVEEEREHRMVWNQFFETLSLDSDIASDTLEIPEDGGMMGEPERVNEGSEFPREEEDYDKTPITVKKHGFEVALTWESTLYSVFDIVAQQMEKASRRMGEYLNRLAFEEVENNLHPNTPLTGSGSLTFELATDARKELLDEKLDPTVMITNTEGERQLLNSDGFQRASDLGDEVQREAAIGRFAGMDVLVDNSGLLGDATTGHAIVADPTEYGYEVVKQDVATEEYDAPARQAQVMQLYTKRAYKAIDPEAAIEIVES